MNTLPHVHADDAPGNKQRQHACACALCFVACTCTHARTHLAFGCIRAHQLLGTHCSGAGHREEAGSFGIGDATRVEAVARRRERRGARSDGESRRAEVPR
jgi:hypothetical protein